MGNTNSNQLKLKNKKSSGIVFKQRGSTPLSQSFRNENFTYLRENETDQHRHIFEIFVYSILQ